MHSNCSLELGAIKQKSLKYLKLNFYLFLKSVSSSTWPLLWVDAQEVDVQETNP